MQIQQPHLLTAQQRKEKSEQVAAGVGGAAGLTTSATKMAGKRGLQAEQSLSNMLGTVTKTQQAVNKTQKLSLACGLHLKTT